MSAPSLPPEPQQPYQSYPPGPMHYGPGVRQPSNGLAVTGMVLGIIAIVFSWVPIFDIIMGALATIFGGLGLRRANQGASGKGQAVTGLVTGILTLVFSLIWVIAIGASL